MAKIAKVRGRSHNLGEKGSIMNMNVSLTEELGEFVKAKVSSGRYTSASEVVREALRIMEQTSRGSRRPTACAPAQGRARLKAASK